MVMLRNDITKVKEINIELIKSALKSLGNATKAELAEHTGISVATCGKILNELCQVGEAYEVSVLSGGYGRPAKSYAYNANYAHVACVYLATDQNKIILASAVGNLLGEIQDEETAEISEVCYETVEAQVARLLERYPNIQSVVIGIPGSITKGVIAVCNLVGLIGVPMQAKLEAQFPGIKIHVENDMNASAYGFYQNSYQKADMSVAFLYAPDGALSGMQEPAGLSQADADLARWGVTIGAGFVSDGHILHGFSGFAGEVAFLPVYQRTNAPFLSVQNIIDIIGCIVPILNPEIIALSGGFFTEENLIEIQRGCEAAIAPQNMPQIIQRADFHQDYISGLICLALERLSCGVALVKKGI